MSKISIFAGLGSDVLFNDSTREQALRDGRSAHGKILLRACHRVFLEEISQAVSQHGHSIGIDIDDFQRVNDLIEPCKRYHRHPAVQNATLFVVQALRYLALEGQDGCKAPKTAAVGGFCVGLLTAVAVGTSVDSLQFLVHAEQCFRVAVLIGLASRHMQRAIRCAPSDLPWSTIIANTGQDEMAAILAAYEFQDQELPLFVSSINSATCVTVSGPGTALERLLDSSLPKKCSTKSTNIHSLYHESKHGPSHIDLILQEVKVRDIRFPSISDILIPLLSTLDGTAIGNNGSTDTNDLLRLVLQMTLAAPTNWQAVQERMLSIANLETSGTPNSPIAVWNYGPGYGALTSHEYSNSGIEVRDVSQRTEPGIMSDSDIAIVGVGIDLPGAPDLDTLWQNLMKSINSCSEIPSDRFHVDDYYTGGSGKPINQGRSMCTKYGNFLDDPFQFDPQLFGISPREASSIDPQQRLILQTVYHALENAGYVADSSPSFARETFGCFVGSATLDYVDNLRNNIDVYYSPGTLRAFISGRISYAFQWSGPSMTVDTACSSSLTALYQAAKALIAGDCRAAIAGGVNVMTSPDMYLGLDKAHFLSSTGQCKAFDEAADGYCRSEGCASFVLKRLSDAVAENDRILGVIKGIAVNQSGLTSSITHPHAPTQERLFKSLLATTDVEPHDVSVVEAHGTGTQAGDPNELKSIRGVFAQGRRPDDKLHVTSLKSNIGHLEAASGGAALAKLLLMLRHKRIPPQALLRNLNPAIAELGIDGTYITTEAIDWATNGKKRTALLNNFGAAGSNGALLLQEYTDSAYTDVATQEHTAYVYGCSARSEKLLEQARDEMLGFLREHESHTRLADICYTSTARRTLQSHRLSTTATTIPELVTKLETARITETPDNPRLTVFLFSGQGSQHAGMGRDLLNLLPTFRKTVLYCHQLLIDWDHPGCLNVMQCEDMELVDTHDPRTIRSLQCGVFVLEVALARSLIQLGIKPALIVGHSLGEFAALVIADVLDLESGLWLVAERARLIIEKCNLFESSMLAVNMPAAEVRRDILGMDQFTELSVSCENSPSDCVVGGSNSDLDLLEKHIATKTGKKATRLDVPVAYHTSALDDVLQELRAVAAKLRFAAPKIAIASNVLGRTINVGEKSVFNSEYVARHCRSLVAFNDSIADALRHDEDLATARWVELGPHPTLLPMVAHHGVKARSATLVKNKPATQTLSELFSAFYQDGLQDIVWRSLFEPLPSKPKLIELPSSPMDKQRYVVPLVRETLHQEEAQPETAVTPFTLLRNRVETHDDSKVIFETPIQALASMIKGHVVCGTALCPASVYTEMVLAAITHRRGSDAEDVAFKLSGIKFLRPLLYVDGSTDTIRITIQNNKNASEDTTFEVTSHATPASDPKVHCSGTIKEQPRSKASSKLRATEQALGRRKAMYQTGEYQTFSTAIMYDKIFSRVVEYSSTYQAVKKIYLDDRLEEIYATCLLPLSEDRYAGHPILLDTMLHVAGFAANLNVDNDTVCICHHVHSMTILRKDIRPGQGFDVHCSNFTNTEDDKCVLADAHAVDDEGVIAVIKGMEFREAKLAKLRAAFEYASHAPSRANSKPVSPIRTPVRDDRESCDREPVGDISRLSSSTRGTSSPGTSRSAATSQDTVITILSEATGVEQKSITARTTLAAMGVDSIMMFELDRKLEEAMGQKPTVAELSACKTVGDMENLVSASASRGGTPVSRTRQTSKAESPTGKSSKKLAEPQLSEDMVSLLQHRLGSVRSPEHIRSDASRTAPIYLIHPGAGICLHYNRIGSLGRDVWSIQDSRLLADQKDDWASIEQVAKEYSAVISRQSSEQSIILAGWSFGGIVAFEAARLLQSSSDVIVLGVVMIDPPPPKDHKPIARETIEVAMAATLKSSKPRSQDAADFEAAIATLTIRNNLRRAALLSRYQPSRTEPMPRIILLRSSEGLDLGVAGLPENEWLHDRSDPSICTDAWEDLIGAPVEVFDIPGDHFTPFEAANIEGTTSAIRKACEMLEDVE